VDIPSKAKRTWRMGWRKHAGACGIRGFVELREVGPLSRCVGWGWRPRIILSEVVNLVRIARVVVWECKRWIGLDRLDRVRIARAVVGECKRWIGLDWLERRWLDWLDRHLLDWLDRHLLDWLDRHLLDWLDRHRLDWDRLDRDWLDRLDRYWLDWLDRHRLDWDRLDRLDRRWLDWQAKSGRWVSMNVTDARPAGQLGSFASDIADKRDTRFAAERNPGFADGRNLADRSFGLCHDEFNLGVTGVVGSREPWLGRLSGHTVDNGTARCGNNRACRAALKETAEQDAHPLPHVVAFRVVEAGLLVYDLSI